MNDFVKKKKRLKSYLGTHLQNVHYLEGTDLLQPHLSKDRSSPVFWCVTMFLKISGRKTNVFRRTGGKIDVAEIYWETGGNYECIR